jgi:hypothetical protein
MMILGSKQWKMSDCSNSRHFSVFEPQHRHLLMKLKAFFYQNDQHKMLYKIDYFTNILESLLFSVISHKWLKTEKKSMIITQNGRISNSM